MAVSARLGLRQSQTLAMTPQLRQAIKLLQLSQTELAAYVADALEANPLLERVEAVGPAGDGRATASPGGVEDPRRAGSLGEHLLGQLAIEVDDPVERVIGAHLVGMLDDAGYLTGEAGELAGRLGCDAARVEATLARLRRFDPPGVFARDLADCLAMQLRERDRLDPAMAALIDNLDLLAGHRLDELRRRCGVDADDLAEMLDEIRSLDPKPGLAFDSAVAQAVVPDVVVRQVADGGWRVELNDDALPRLLVNRRYHATVKRQARTRDEKDYLSERLSSANWLIRSLDQRANTILRVASEIVHRQQAFFEHGVERLKPLVQRDVAAALEMHESTVSRSTANKYMATPRGTLAMRFFFTSAIASVGGAVAAHSSTAVSHHIKAAIEGEDAADVLSDERLAGMLRSKGIDIARRTVAKYRQAMHIPSSPLRRRMKKRLR